MRASHLPPFTLYLRAGTAVVFVSLYYQTATKKHKSKPKEEAAPAPKDVEAVESEDAPLLNQPTQQQ